MELKQLLSRVEDGRGLQGRQYSLTSLLLLVIAGKMRGCTSLAACCRFGKRLTRNQRKRLGLQLGKAPSHSTVTVAIGAINIASLESNLGVWHTNDSLLEGSAVAVDGKHLCGSADGEKQAVHLLSAFAVTLNKTLAQQRVAQGANEITAMLDFLDSFPVSGLIITGDAIFAQRDICQKVVEKGGDFVFTVKENQSALKARIEAATKAAKVSLSPSGHAQHKRRRST